MMFFQPGIVGSQARSGARCVRHSGSGSSAGFSLIEVLLAVGVLAFSLVAVLGLLSLNTRSITDVQDSTNAARMTDSLRAELERVAVASLGMDEVLYANRSADRVVLEDQADNDPVGGTPPGIAEEDRYFRIELERVEPTDDQLLGFATDSGFVAYSVRVEWPYMVRTGPTSAEESQPQNRRVAIYNLAIPR